MGILYHWVNDVKVNVLQCIVGIQLYVGYVFKHDYNSSQTFNMVPSKSECCGLG